MVVKCLLCLAGQTPRCGKNCRFNCGKVRSVCLGFICRPSTRLNVFTNGNLLTGALGCE